MKTTKKQASGFLILYFISTGFYANRILTRFIFQSAGKWAWIMIWLIALLILIISVPLYHIIAQKKYFPKQPSLFTRIFLTIYLLISIFLTMTFLLTLTNTGWLFETPLLWVLAPLFFITYYILRQKTDVLLRVATLCFYPILLQYLIFVFAKNKSFDLYAIIPFTSPTTIRWFIVIVAGINMLFDLYLCLFYFSECETNIKKWLFFSVIVLHVFSLCYDSLIASGQFGVLLSEIPFAYYESWRVINFGQYIVYLDTFAFFYWVTSAFLRITLLFYLIKTITAAKPFYYLSSYILIALTVVYVLSHAPLYMMLRVPLLSIGTAALMLALGGQLYSWRKEVKKE